MLLLTLVMVPRVYTARERHMELDIDAWVKGWHDCKYAGDRIEQAAEHFRANGDLGHFLRRLVNAPLPYGSYRHVLPWLVAADSR